MCAVNTGLTVVLFATYRYVTGKGPLRIEAAKSRLMTCA